MADVYYPLVVHWCKPRLPIEDVREVVHEVFIAVQKSINNFENTGPDKTFRGWLRQITDYKIKDYWRNRSKNNIGKGGSDHIAWLAGQPDSNVEFSDSVESDQMEINILIHRVLSLIRPVFQDRTCKIFERTVIRGERVVDVAEDLSMSPTAVTKAKGRVLQRLRKELEGLL